MKRQFNRDTINHLTTSINLLVNATSVQLETFTMQFAIRGVVNEMTWFATAMKMLPTSAFQMDSHMIDSIATVLTVMTSTKCKLNDCKQLPIFFECLTINQIIPFVNKNDETFPKHFSWIIFFGLSRLRKKSFNFFLIKRKHFEQQNSFDPQSSAGISVSMLISSRSICVSAPDTDNSVLWMLINIRLNLLSPTYDGDRWSHEFSLQALSVWPIIFSYRLQGLTSWIFDGPPTHPTAIIEITDDSSLFPLLFFSECRQHFRQTLRPCLLDHELWIQFHSYCRWRPRKRVHDFGRSARLELLHLRLLTFAAKAQ